MTFSRDQVLVEKLLRSCPDLGKVYILLRSKNGLDPKQRLEQQFVGCKVFSSLASSLVQEKVRPLEGELHSPNLGLDEKSQQVLIDTVHVVFHVAASVRFDDPLRQCMRENVEGTKHVIDLCHRLTQLKSLVHVSTAYAYCHQDTTEERLYPMKVQPHQLLDLCTWMDEKSLELGCAKLFEGRPNTYTFTKAVAEHYVDQNRGELPVAIARPSIVTASKKEPLVGWVDSVNGPGGATLLGKRFSHAFSYHS
jgi:thioester reductase-like protein